MKLSEMKPGDTFLVECVVGVKTTIHKKMTVLNTRVLSDYGSIPNNDLVYYFDKDFMVFAREANSQEEFEMANE